MDAYQPLGTEAPGPNSSSSGADNFVGFKPMAPGLCSATEGRYIWKPPSSGPPNAPQSVPKVSNHSVRYGLVQKVQALTLLPEGFPVAYITQRTGIPPRSLSRIKAVAAERGYRPAEDARILEAYIIDGKRSGRPKKIATETQLSKGVEADSVEDEQQGDDSFSET